MTASKTYKEIQLKLYFNDKKVKTRIICLEKEEKIDELLEKISKGGLVHFGPIAFWAADFKFMERLN